jgi:hypothetical protein
MAFPVWAAMLAVSALKAKADAERSKRERGEAAIKETVSPWSGVTPNQISHADTLGTLAGGAASGLAMQQSMANQEQNEKLMNLYQQNMQLQNNKLSGPLSGMAGWDQMSDAEKEEIMSGRRRA